MAYPTSSAPPSIGVALAATVRTPRSKVLYQNDSIAARRDILL